MRPPDLVPTVRDYLRMAAMHWMLILTATLASAGAGYVAVLVEDSDYTASVDLFATVAGDSGVRAAYDNNLGATARMSTYGQMAVSTLVLQRTIDQLRLPTSTGALAENVAVTLVPESVLLHVAVTSDDSSRAIATANALASNLARASQEVESTDQGPAAELVPVGATRSATRVEDSTLDAVILGGAIGLGLSVVLVVARELLRDRLLRRTQIDSVVENVLSRTVVEKS